LVAGAAAIGGGSGGLPSLSSTESKSAASQYCPPTSQQPGKPKNPSPDGCGNPKTK
jgi:hypothetical protein